MHINNNPTVFALDLSLSSLEYLCNKYVQANVIAIRGDLSKLPFKSCCFDKVLSANAIQQLPNDDLRNRAFREIARVANKFSVTVRPEVLRLIVNSGYLIWCGKKRDGKRGRDAIGKGPFFAGFL